MFWQVPIHTGAIPILDILCLPTETVASGVSEKVVDTRSWPATWCFLAAAVLLNRNGMFPLMTWWLVAFGPFLPGSWDESRHFKKPTFRRKNSKLAIFPKDLIDNQHGWRSRWKWQGRAIPPPQKKQNMKFGNTSLNDKIIWSESISILIWHVKNFVPTSRKYFKHSKKWSNYSDLKHDLL